MWPGSTVGALGDMKHSTSLSGHTLCSFSPQKVATQQGANLLLQWGGEGGDGGREEMGVGWGVGNNNHCTVRAPITVPSSDYI